MSARAGDDALLRLGFEEAAVHYRAALAALEFTAGPRTVQRAELHLALGRACQAAYQLDEALGGFRRAAECAMEVGDLHLLGEAAVGVATATEFAMADAEIEALLSTALDALAPDAPARIELLAGLARTLPGHTDEAIDRVREAVQLARTLDAPRPLTIALATAILVTWSPDRVLAPPRRDRRGDRPGRPTSTWSSSRSRHAPGVPPRSTSSASTGWPATNGRSCSSGPSRAGARSSSRWRR